MGPLVALLAMALKVVPLHPRAATLVLRNWMEGPTEARRAQYADMITFGSEPSEDTRGFVALQDDHRICAVAALTAEPLQLVHLASNDGESATRLFGALLRSCEGNLTLHEAIDPRWRIALAFLDD